MTERLGRPGALPPLRADDLFLLPVGSLVGRISFHGGPHPSSWNVFRSVGPLSVMRFDHHPEPLGADPDLGIAYAAPARARLGSSDPLVACVLECFGATRLIDPRTAQPWFTLWGFDRELRLLDLVDGPWITRAGGNAAISSGPRAVCREWSRAIHAEYDVHGMIYQTSSVPMTRSIALYERTLPLMPPRPRLNLPLAHPGLAAALRRIAREFDLDLVP